MARRYLIAALLACASCSATPTQRVVDQCDAATDAKFANRPPGQLIEPNRDIEACMLAKGYALDLSARRCQFSRDPFADGACYRRAQ